MNKVDLMRNKTVRGCYNWLKAVNPYAADYFIEYILKEINQKNNQAVINYGSRTVYVCGIISISIAWGTTPQGHNYWLNLYTLAYDRQVKLKDFYKPYIQIPLKDV